MVESCFQHDQSEVQCLRTLRSPVKEVATEPTELMNSFTESSLFNETAPEKLFKLFMEGLSTLSKGNLAFLVDESSVPERINFLSQDIDN